MWEGKSHFSWQDWERLLRVDRSQARSEDWVGFGQKVLGSFHKEWIISVEVLYISISVLILENDDPGFYQFRWKAFWLYLEIIWLTELFKALWLKLYLTPKQSMPRGGIELWDWKII